jgi:hypothetical protein
MTDNITLPRAVVEQVREALTCGDGESRHWCMHCDDHVPNSLGSLDILAALDAALAEPDATREPATDEQAAAAYDGKRGTRQWVDFRDGWLHAERFHGIRKEDKT